MPQQEQSGLISGYGPDHVCMILNLSGKLSNVLLHEPLKIFSCFYV